MTVDWGWSWASWRFADEVKKKTCVNDTAYAATT